MYKDNVQIFHTSWCGGSEFFSAGNWTNQPALKRKRAELQPGFSCNGTRKLWLACELVTTFPHQKKNKQLKMLKVFFFSFPC